MLGSTGDKEGDPNGESDGPLHRDDSTFGEYMAGLDRRSSSGNVRCLNRDGMLLLVMQLLLRLLWRCNAVLLLCCCCCVHTPMMSMQEIGNQS